MKVKQLYKKYRIPKNLQEHMLRAGALASIICESWIGKKIDKDLVIIACLFHDAGKIVKFDFTRPELFGKEAKNIDYWRRVQVEVIKKYGQDEVTANYKICRDMGLNLKILEIIKNSGWDDAQNLLDSGDMESVVETYCDMRIGPFGILSVDRRIGNLKDRTGGDRQYSLLFETAHILENEIQKNVKVDLKSIGDSQINERFEDLMETEVI